MRREEISLHLSLVYHFGQGRKEMKSTFCCIEFKWYSRRVCEIKIVFYSISCQIEAREYKL